jgi:arabinose-5-phosphate isomerase
MDYKINLILKMNLKDIVEYVISREIAGLEDLKYNFDLVNFSSLIDKIVFTRGKVIITGVGKSGIISRKIAASLCSIGIGSVFLNPCDASHGDMGIISQNDIVIILSNSGESKEIINIVNYCHIKKISIVAISRNAKSYLVTNSDISIILPNTAEVCDFAIPTTSSTMMLIFGHILTIGLKEKTQLKSEEYCLYHPGGTIGLLHSRVRDVMVKGNSLPLVKHKASLIETTTSIASYKLGLTLVVDENDLFIGIVTIDNINDAKDSSATALSLMSNSYKLVEGDVKLSQVVGDLNNYGQLVVVKDKKVEGIITKDIIDGKVRL